MLARWFRAVGCPPAQNLCRRNSVLAVRIVIHHRVLKLLGACKGGGRSDDQVVFAQGQREAPE